MLVLDGGKVDLIMKKLHVVLMALAAVFAFSAVLAGSASAEVTLLAEWLVKGLGVAAGASFASSSGEELTFGHLGLLELKCSFFLDGLVEADGVGVIESALNLAGELISGTALTGLALACKSLAMCENTADLELWLINMPWLTLTYLMENGTLLTLFYKEGDQPGFAVKCLLLGMEIEDSDCGGETSELDKNEPTDVGWSFSPAELEAEKLEGTCGGEAQKIFQNGSGLTQLLNGETLTVSSE
jgi:hypothetical protein